MAIKIKLGQKNSRAALREKIGNASNYFSKLLQQNWISTKKNFDTREDEKKYFQFSPPTFEQKRNLIRREISVQGVLKGEFKKTYSKTFSSVFTRSSKVGWWKKKVFLGTIVGWLEVKFSKHFSLGLKFGWAVGNLNEVVWVKLFCSEKNPATLHKTKQTERRNKTRDIFFYLIQKQNSCKPWFRL